MTIDLVTNMNASGAGSLSQTLADAAAGDTIDFVFVFANDTINLSGALDITKNITIDGSAGGGHIALSGGGASTDVRVEAGVSATLTGLQIVNGMGHGATGHGAGGGIFNAGSLTLSNDVIANDTAYGGNGPNGAIGAGGGAGHAGVGGVYNTTGSSLTITAGTVSFSNNAGFGGNGGNGGDGTYGAGGTGGHGGSQINGGAITQPTSGTNGGGYGGGAGGLPGEPGSNGSPYLGGGTGRVRAAGAHTSQYGGYGSYGGYGGYVPIGGYVPVGYIGVGGYVGVGGGYGQTRSNAGGGGGGGFGLSDIGGPGQSTPACFRQGTRIATPGGEVAVEDLRPGDMVATARGLGAARVRWVGYRHLVCSRHPDPAALWPVRIAADAFAPGQPARDLFLSGDHAVLLPGRGGALVPVQALINGATIVREPAEDITYYHVELDRHDVLLADGLPAESYLDTGNRAAFSNGGAVVQHTPDFALRVWEAASCVPLLREGAAVDAAWRRLHARARRLGHRETAEPDLVAWMGGRALEGMHVGTSYRIRLPGTAGCLRLRSRWMAPGQAPAAGTDPRRLGVAVTFLDIDGVAIPLDSPSLGAGWHAAEGAGSRTWRWTDGDAALTVPAARELRLLLAMPGAYWAAPAGRRGAARMAG